MMRSLVHFVLKSSIVVVALAASLDANAAISQGPKITNSVAVQQQRNSVFYEAEQSNQERLKVGRERYAQKQVARAKIIAAMDAQLRARQQTVVIRPGTPVDTHTDEIVSRFRPSLSTILFAIVILALVYYLRRIKLAIPRRVSGPKTSFVRFNLD